MKQYYKDPVTKEYKAMRGGGADGANGIPCTHEWNGTVLTVTSASGTSSANLQGPSGDAGVSPGVSVSKVGKVATISVTDATGTKTVEIKDGEDGEPGTNPHIGANGNWYIGETDTGVKAQGEPGSDYVLTDDDKAEIAEQAAELVDNQLLKIIGEVT